MIDDDNLGTGANAWPRLRDRNQRYGKTKDRRESTTHKPL
jgi:hypothetical protein